MVGSMGRVGAAGDNAAKDSFFSLLQKNVLDRRTRATREEPDASKASQEAEAPEYRPSTHQSVQELAE